MEHLFVQPKAIAYWQLFHYREILTLCVENCITNTAFVQLTVNGSWYSADLKRLH